MCKKDMKCLTGGCGCMKDVGLVFLRIGVGLPFIIHGIAKFMSIAGTTAFFGSIGLAPIFVYIVAGLELLGGLMILLGLWSCIGGWIISVIMAGAYILVKNKMPFFGGYELDTVFFFSGLAIAFLGSGKYSLKKDACCESCQNVCGVSESKECTHTNCACGDCSKCGPEKNTCTHMNCKCGDCGKCQ